MREPLLTAEEVADLLSVPTSWVYEAVKDGRLTCVRVGKRTMRFEPAVVDQFIRQSQEKT